ncbi:unnamed protein product [Vicia faba]|uniref:Proline dehydrogenase n=1 Tax=Vicia faba TaxID=3906 RepID=A0AAV0Z2J4_VICFA|nr:unnamed protein product [Vicia faba]
MALVKLFLKLITLNQVIYHIVSVSVVLLEITISLFTLSGKLVTSKAHELGIGKVNHKMKFAQLYGVSEAISFGLSNAWFKVRKYMPFGPIETVMPYLLRRAGENRGVLVVSGFDRQLMR